MQLKTHYELTELEYTKLLSETEPAESLAHWFSLINTISIELGMEQDEEATRLCQILRFIRKLSTSKAAELAATTANIQRGAITLLKRWVADGEESCRHDDLIEETKELLAGVA